MIYYLNALSLKAINDYFESYEYFIKAKHLFYELGAYKRIFYCDMSIAALYSKNGNYNKALLCYQNGLKSNKNIALDKPIIGLLYRNIAWIHIVRGMYTEALDYLKESAKYDYKSENLILYHLLCYYNLDMLESCNYWIDRGKKEITHRKMKYEVYCKMIQIKQGKGCKTFIHDLMKLCEHLKYKDMEDYIFHVRILIQNLIKENELQTAFKYSLQLNDLYENGWKFQ